MFITVSINNMVARKKQSTGKSTKNEVEKIKKSKRLEDKKLRKKKVQSKLLQNKNKIRVLKEKIQKRNYTAEDLKKVVNAVNNGISYRKAAALYQVPLTSIFRAVKNPAKQKSIVTPPTVLSYNEEQEIVNWLLFRAESGFPATKCDLLDSVQRYILKLKRKTPFTNGRPGRHWYEAFKNRHPNLTIRKAQHLTLNRASVSEEDLREWFAELHVKLMSKNLINIDSSRVFNCDETNVQLLPKPEKVISQKGARSVYKVVDANEKESLTALFMYSANGTRAPPMIMYKYKGEVPPRILKNIPQDFSIGISDNGWMTAESFFDYIVNVFYPWLVKSCVVFPIILYLDGHSSHINIPLLSFCRQKQIELVILYPNSTHMIQPLDISVFHPFKEIWRKVVPKWKADNQISKLKPENFALALKEALNSFAEEKKCVQSGFRASGLMPFNPDAINYNVLKKNMKKNKQQIIETNPKKDNIAPLQLFEDSLPDGLFQDFKKAEPTGIWSNDIENLGLFNQWLRMKNTNCGTFIF